MPDLNGVPGSVNGLATSNNIVAGASSLFLNLLSAAGTIGVEKLAASQGALVVPTGNELNPVRVVASPTASLAQNTNLLLVAGFIGVVLIGIVAAMSSRKG